MTNPWLQRLSPKAGRVRLLCFPHAGGTAAVYRSWPAALSEHVEVHAVQLPGRANRFSEAPLRAIPQMADEIVAALGSWLSMPFVFFGHSMGSLVALQVTRALAAAGKPLPQHLFVSGRRAPHVPDLAAPLSPLSDADFVTEIDRRYGGIPREILAEADVLALLLPSLRADIAALESYPQAVCPPLSCPITVFGGADDRLAPAEHLQSWQGLTTRGFRVRVWPGGHFYLDQQRAAVLGEISATLSPLLRDAVYSEPAL